MNLDKLIPWLSFGLTFIVSMIGIPIWVFTTFATQSYVKEVNEQILKYVDERHLEAVSHSDLNRAQMQGQFEKTAATLEEIKEIVKTIEIRSWESRDTTSSKRTKSTHN